MMTGRPESRRVFARLPPLASYSATCSLTHCHALGSYSPSRAMSTLYRRSTSSPLGVWRWLRRRDKDVTPLSAHSPTSPQNGLDRVKTVGQDVSSKNALHGLRVVTHRTLLVVRDEMNVDDVVALGQYAKVNTRRVFLRQEVDDGRVLRAFLEQASRSVARSERVRATASVERSFSVGSQQWDPRWREDRRDPRGREFAVASRASARRDRDDSRRCLRIVATPEKEAIVRALPRSARWRETGCPAPSPARRGEGALEQPPAGVEGHLEFPRRRARNEVTEH